MCQRPTRLSNHAMERWAQRCPHLSVFEEVANSKPLSKGQVRALAIGWPGALEKAKERGNRIRITPSSMLVVMTDDNCVVTIVDYGGIKARSKRNSRRKQ